MAFLFDETGVDKVKGYAKSHYSPAERKLETESEKLVSPKKPLFRKQAAAMAVCHIHPSGNKKRRYKE